MGVDLLLLQVHQSGWKELEVTTTKQEEEEEEKMLKGKKRKKQKFLVKRSNTIAAWGALGHGDRALSGLRGHLCSTRQCCSCSCALSSTARSRPFRPGPSSPKKGLNCF